jgi:uncharacterized protein
MTTVMSRAEREQFLSDLHVGVVSAATGAGGTLTVPIWYDYSPDRGVWVITSQVSPKAKAIEATGRFSLAVQDEAIPYKYVSVEGPVVEIRPVDLERDLLPISIRYLGADLGAHYAQQWSAITTGDDRVYTMRPERWASTDLTETFRELRASMPAPVT